MFEPVVNVFGVSIATYPLLIALAVLLGGAYALLRAPLVERARRADAYLLALVGGLVAARLLHVGLHWAYFQDHTGEILNWRAGGLDWRGAVLGAWLSLHLVSGRWGLRRVAVYDALTLLVPLLAMGGWWGCWAASCAYGAEVVTLADYPAWLVWEGRDVFGIYAPRFHTQQVGLLGALALLLLAIIWLRRGWLFGRRVWLMLLLLALLMFALGFGRGDATLTVAGWRVEQGLDGLIAFMALGQLFTGRRNPKV